MARDEIPTLNDALSREDVDLITDLVDSDGVDVSSGDPEVGNQTPLMRLGYINVEDEDRAAILELLLLKNPDVNLADDMGRTALCHACLAGRADFVRRLGRVCGCDPNIPDKGGNNAAMYAVCSENAAIVETFLSAFSAHNLDLERVNMESETPLSEAESRGLADIVQLLSHHDHHPRQKARSAEPSHTLTRRGAGGQQEVPSSACSEPGAGDRPYIRYRGRRLKPLVIQNKLQLQMLSGGSKPGSAEVPQGIPCSASSSKAGKPEWGKTGGGRGKGNGDGGGDDDGVDNDDDDDDDDDVFEDEEESCSDQSGTLSDSDYNVSEDSEGSASEVEQSHDEGGESSTGKPSSSKGDSDAASDHGQRQSSLLGRLHRRGSVSMSDLTVTENVDLDQVTPGRPNFTKQRSEEPPSSLKPHRRRLARRAGAKNLLIQRLRSPSQESGSGDSFPGGSSERRNSSSLPDLRDYQAGLVGTPQTAVDLADIQLTDGQGGSNTQPGTPHTPEDLRLPDLHRTNKVTSGASPSSPQPEPPTRPKLHQRQRHRNHLVAKLK